MSAAKVLVRRAGTALAAAAGALAALLTLASGAWAHTEFESSDPADGATVVGPLEQIVLTFTEPASESGDGFEVLDSSGAAIAPIATETADGTAFVLRFSPPLPDGDYGVRWEVQAGDAHPIDGTVRFAVTGAPAPSAGPTDQTASGGQSGLDDLLEEENRGPRGAVVGRVGRALTMGGTIVGLGTLAALAWVVRGRRDELHAMLIWVRLAGAVIAVGGLVELAAFLLSRPEGLGDLLGANPGLAVTLKVLGGLAVVVGFSGGAGVMRAAAGPDAAASASAGASDEPAPRARLRWVPASGVVVGFLGFVLVLASFWFDGHTVSRGPWVLHAGVNLVHLLAAAVWAGALIAITLVVWRRWRRREPSDFAGIAVRFSPVATAGLAVVFLAGAVMAAIVLDTPADLLASEWGRLLLVKLAAVGVAAALGGYNQFRLTPAVERDRGSPVLAREVVRTLTVESVLVLLVIVMTAWLVAAAT